MPDPLHDAVRGRDPVDGAAVRRHHALHPEADPEHGTAAVEQHLPPHREVGVRDAGVPGPGDSTTCEWRSTSSGDTSSCWTTVGSTPGHRRDEVDQVPRVGVVVVHHHDVRSHALKIGGTQDSAAHDAVHLEVVRQLDEVGPGPGLEPPDPVRPSIAAGVEVTAASASGSGTPASRTASRSDEARVAVDPAITSGPGEPGDAAADLDRQGEPSRYSPSAAPAAAIASVTSAVRPARQASASTDGCTCTPSATSSTYADDSSSAATGPGLAVVQRRHRVEQVRAGGRPGLERGPRLVVRRVRVADRDHHSGGDQLGDRDMAPGSSGASVTIRRWPRPASTSRSTASRVGGRSSDGSCAPARRGLSQGPSRWMPATSPVLGQRRQRRAGGREPVHRVGDQARDHRGGAVGEVGAHDSGHRVRVAAVERRASAAVHVHVHEARAPPARAATTRAGSGGGPAPTASTRSPSMTTQPSTTIPVGSASAPAASTRAPSGSGVDVMSGVSGRRRAVGPGVPRARHRHRTPGRSPPAAARG